MMRLDINLATQPYEDGRRFWMRWGPILGVAGVVTLALIVTTISSWAAARKDQVQISKFKDDIAKCEQERARAQEVLDRPANRDTRDQSKFINSLIRRKSFSWTQVFSDLERMMPPELHVTAIHPEVAKDNQLEIKLSVSGKSRDRAFQLIHRMEQSPRFYQPVIEEESHQAGQNGDVWHFEIASAYIPQVDLVPVPAKTDAPQSGSPGEKTDGAKQGGLKTPAAKVGMPKPAAMKPAAATDRKAH
jgi:Tfp pilus assembly protein PilN